MSGTRRIELPTELLDELDELSKKANMGYATTAEGVKDSVRRWMDQLRALVVNQRFKSEVEAAQVEAN